MPGPCASGVLQLWKACALIGCRLFADAINRRWARWPKNPTSNLGGRGKVKHLQLVHSMKNCTELTSRLQKVLCFHACGSDDEDAMLAAAERAAKAAKRGEASGLGPPCKQPFPKA
ncbi:g4898 [Coccomyxa elongata]